MIDLLHSFFASIAEFFQTVWNFVSFIFGELIDFFRMVGSAVSFAFSIISFIPSIYLAFGIAMLLVLIIYIIVGRNAGGD